MLTINALENGDFLNFILDFLAARHPNSLTRKQSTHLCFFLRPQKQDVSPMSHFDSKGNVPYKPKKTHKPSNSKLLSYVLIYIFNLFILFNKDVCVCVYNHKAFSDFSIHSNFSPFIFSFASLFNHTTTRIAILLIQNSIFLQLPIIIILQHQSRIPVFMIYLLLSLCNFLFCFFFSIIIGNINF